MKSLNLGQSIDGKPSLVRRLLKFTLLPIGAVGFAVAAVLEMLANRRRK